MRLGYLFVSTTLLISSLSADSPTLTVQGSGTIYKAADQFSLTVGVITQNKEADQALDENNQKMNALKKNLMDLSLSREELQTGRFRINPVYSARPKNAPARWQAEIIGYSVENKLEVKTTKIGQAGEIIDAATKAGANSVGQLVFDLQDAHKFRKDVIALATRHAMEDASALATAAGLTIGPVQSIALDTLYVTPRRTSETFYMKAANSATPIEVGEVPLHATVTMIYELEEEKNNED